ncbi:MAG: protein-methionine-sulfoxide reductase heme-binding subunit MsrQ [Steroidobacteraceae bacterium]
MNTTQQFRFIYKPLVFAACAVPAVLMLLGIVGKGPMDLGADPVNRLIHACGITALNMLLITLLVTPVRQMSGWNHLIRLRRMLGLFAFFYAVAHFTCYAWLDQGLDVAAIGADIVKRPYITIGMAALLMLIALAVTSTNGMMRRLGRKWTKLHRLIYVLTALGVWHFYWQVKKDISEPLLYVGMFAVLMAWRIGWRFRGKFAPARAPEKI